MPPTWQASQLLDVGVMHDALPLFDIPRNESLGVLGALPDGQVAESRKPGADGLAFENGLHFRVQRIDDRARGAFGSQQHGPGGFMKSGKHLRTLLCQSSPLGSQRRTLAGGNADPLDTLCVYMLPATGHLIEGNIDLLANERIHRRPGALKRNMHHLQARGQTEYLHGHVRRGAVARAAVCQFLRPALGHPNQLFYAGYLQTGATDQYERPFVNGADGLEVVHDVVADVFIERRADGLRGGADQKRIAIGFGPGHVAGRSEERRVGKEWRCRWHAGTEQRRKSVESSSGI